MSTFNWFAIAVVFAIPLLFFLAAFVIGCFEKISVYMFQSAPPGYLPPYTLATAAQHAVAEGFYEIDRGIHVKYGERITGLLMISSDQLILAVIGEGSLYGMPTKKTILYTRMKNAQILSAADEAGNSELDPNSIRKFLMNASFSELLAAQRKLISETPSIPLRFDEAKKWDALNELLRLRSERLVQAGHARFCDAERSCYRHTPLASFRTTIIHGIVQVLNPKNHFRHTKKRAG